MTPASTASTGSTRSRARNAAGAAAPPTPRGAMRGAIGGAVRAAILAASVVAMHAAGCERLAQLMRDRDEFGRIAHPEVALVGQGRADLLDDAAGPRRHHDDARGEV